MSFLGLEGYHVFVTGAGGGIGSQAVKEFLSKSLAICIARHYLQNYSIILEEKNWFFVLLFGAAMAEQFTEHPFVSMGA